MAAVPGWYPDPTGTPGLRFWDGQAWTSQTAAPAMAAAMTPATTATAPATTMPVQGDPFFGAAPDYSRPPSVPYPGQWQQARNGRSRKKVPLIVLASVLGVCVVAAVVNGLVQRNTDNNIYDRTSVVLPASFDGYTKNTGAAADSFTSLASSIPFPIPPLGALYESPTGGRAVFIVGRVRLDATTLDSQLSAAETGFRRTADKHGWTYSSFRNAGPGPLGGKMACSTWATPTLNSTDCFFADAGAFGDIVLPTPDADAQAVTLRPEIEKRS